MENNKKFGLITIVFSLVLGIASLVFSENICHGGTGDSWLNLILICLRINIYEYFPENAFENHIYLQTKYLLLACATILAIGILWHKGALPVPGTKREAKPGQAAGTATDDA